MTQPTNELLFSLALPRLWGISEQSITILAGDVGGTKANIAFYNASPSGMVLIKQARYSSDEFKSCIEILQRFLQEGDHPKPDRICLGVAGPVLDGKVEITNLDWFLDSADIRTQLGVTHVSLINDLEAMAYGLAGLHEEDLIVIHTGNVSAKGNMAIVAPGTGLGEAGLYWDGHAHHPFPTEGGHCDFCPRTETDIELFKYLQKQHGVVSWERLIAGPAIYDIYRFLRDEKKHEEPGWLKEAIQQAEDPSAVVSHAALENKAVICTETMKLFVRYLARETGNLVLKMKATGGVFLGGGIPPKIATLLLQESFYKNYLDCDRMQNLLEAVPIYIIKNQNSGLRGAA